MTEQSPTPPYDPVAPQEPIGAWPTPADDVPATAGPGGGGSGGRLRGLARRTQLLVAGGVVGAALVAGGAGFAVGHASAGDEGRGGSFPTGGLDQRGGPGDDHGHFGAPGQGGPGQGGTDDDQGSEGSTT